MRRVWTLAVTALAFGPAACGGDAVDREPAIEAQEGNEVRLGPVAYRVVRFRELNPEATADAAVVPSVERGPDELVFAAFLQACNRGETVATPTSAIQLENAFGTAYQPVREGVDPAFAYTPRRLSPGECLPAAGSVADRSFDAAALVFTTPEDVTADRPLVLELRGTGSEGETARIRLDL